MTQNPPDPQNPGGEQPHQDQPGGFPPPPPPSYGSSSQPPADQPPSYGSPNQPPSYGSPNQPPSYGAPQQPGGFPPPPPPGGGFPGAAPPPPPGGQYGQYGAPQYGGPAGGPWGAGQPPFSVGAAISYGWNAFKSNAGVWIGAFLAVAVISVVLQSLLNPSVNVDLGDAGSGGIPVVEYTLVGQLMAGIASIVTYLLSAVLIQGAVHKVNGRFQGFGSFTSFTHAGPLFVAAAAMGLVSLVLGLLSIVSPFLTSILNLVWGVLSTFVLYIAADRGLQVVDAVKESFRLVTSNLGSVIVLWLATIGLVIAGIIVVCFTGLIIVVPLLVLAWAFAYKTLSGQQVAAP